MGFGFGLESVAVVSVDLLGAWERVRAGALAVQLLPAQFGVVRAGTVRKGSVVVICCCCEEREAMVFRPRDGGNVAVLRTVVLTSSGRGARVDEDVLSSCEFMREAFVRLLRGGEVSNVASSGRSVPLG